MKKKILIIIVAILVVAMAAVALRFILCDHVPEEEWVVEKEATIREDGKRHQRCSLCGWWINRETVYATGTPGLQYSIREDDTCQVYVLGVINETEIFIPRMYEGKPVTSIAPGAFMGQSFVSVEIPSTVKEICREAFMRCNLLEKVIIPDDSQLTEIDISAFHACEKLEEIHIPASVTTIDWSAFTSCNALKSVTFAKDSQLTTISSNAFLGCTSLVSIELPSSVTEIGESAFSYCSALESISFGKNPQITTISSDMFNECKQLKSIEIPASVTTIETAAFRNCMSLKSVSFSKDTQLSSIGNWAFTFCLELESIEIPASVTKINERAFERCDKLTKVTILSKTAEIHNHYDTFEQHTVLYGYEGSTTEQYANTYDREFVKIN